MAGSVLLPAVFAVLLCVELKAVRGCDILQAR